MQIPDATIQGKLKTQIGATALGSVAFWKHRVSHSRGHEILIDRELTVLASSKEAWPSALYGDKEIVGAKLYELVPGPLAQHIDSAGAQTIRQLQDMGFFDGLIRGVHMEIELSAPMFCQVGHMDIWPILTAEQSIIGHIVGYPASAPNPKDGFLGFRVRKSDVQLNKDAGK
jgi:hypothetical protein